jgi:nitrate reductase NapAB chaperone NapD
MARQRAEPLNACLLFANSMPEQPFCQTATKSMPAAVSGLVITTTEDQSHRAAIDAAVAAAGCFEAGDWQENRLPVALEAVDERASREWFEWLCGLPGVVKVDLAFVAWDD